MIKYRLKGLEDRSHSLVGHWQLGVGVITALAGIGLFGAEYFQLTAGKWQVADILYLSLLGANVVLIPTWIWAVRRELDLLVYWLDPDTYDPPNDVRQMIDAVFFAVLLVLQVVTTRFLPVYGIIFIAVNLGALLIVQRQVNREVSDALDESRERLVVRADENRQDEKDLLCESLDVIEDYFLSRPHGKRHILIIAGGVIGTIAAFIAKYQGDGIFQMLAYVAFLITIVASEGIIAAWRLKRDDQLRAISRKLRRLAASSLDVPIQGDGSVPKKHVLGTSRPRKRKR